MPTINKPVQLSYNELSKRYPPDGRFATEVFTTKRSCRMRYRRVTSEDRVRIKDFLEQGLTKSETADKLGFHKSSIGREISRNPT